MGSEGFDKWTRVILPAALPFLVSGMKQGWAFAWRSLMAAEIYVTILTGFGLTFGSWASAAAALLIGFAGILPRIRVEERALAQAFGSDYTEYANSTGRLLPHIR